MNAIYLAEGLALIIDIGIIIVYLSYIYYLSSIYLSIYLSSS